MGHTQTADTPTFETVWALVKEVAENQKETDRQMKETDRQMKESKKDFDLQMKESKKDFDLRIQETDRIVKEIGKRLGDFTNNFGDIVEHMIAPNLVEKFNDLGYEFEEASTNHKFRNKKHGIRFEVDVLLQNGDIAMLVEIKADLTISDINRHIERLEKMRKHADLRGDKRTFLGAVAGIAVKDDEREYALNQGLFLIEPSGENFNITSPYSKPKEW
jgi:hypothetical protein